MNMNGRIDIDKYLAESRVARVHTKVKDGFKSNNNLFGHDLNHIHRDLINSLIIGETEECDMSIVTASVLMHDIGFLYGGDPYEHHVTGAEHCREWLDDDWTENEKSEIRECIFRHKGVSEVWNTMPETIEQRIVCDADLLDKMGYIGLVQGLRVYTEFGRTGREEFRDVRKVIDTIISVEEIQFYTTMGRKIAQERNGVKTRIEIMKKVKAEMEIYADYEELFRDI